MAVNDEVDEMNDLAFLWAAPREELRAGSVTIDSDGEEEPNSNLEANAAETEDCPVLSKRRKKDVQSQRRNVVSFGFKGYALSELRKR